MKKVRTISELHLDKDDLTVDRNEQTVQGPGVFKASYKSTLLGALLEKEHNDENNYNKALIGGLWVIFGRYLTVWPWSPDFSTLQNGIKSQVVWIRLPRLPERGRFARLAVYVNLRKPLVSKGRKFGNVNGKIDDKMEDRNREQTKGVGDNGVLRLQVTKSKYMDAKAKNRAKGKGVMIGVGPKSGPSALRPNNGRFGVKAIVGMGCFMMDQN
ncbi:hypothetical protein Goshw_024652 [Gossypium schwendimanii]|uniref:DUF4283 domain-containing protein n=1 Tax=Gossypium schwendimanii TaxID=34291 RepID=A0A7J9KZV7_GOSSC|nr:hypothetical protein [Gossypium schwendimanii]